MNPSENVLIKVKQNGRREIAQMLRLLRGFAELPESFLFFHMLHGHNKENGKCVLIYLVTKPECKSVIFTQLYYNITKAKRTLQLADLASTIYPWVYAADVLTN